jgi:hypothetical protein
MGRSGLGPGREGARAGSLLTSRHWRWRCTACPADSLLPPKLAPEAPERVRPRTRHARVRFARLIHAQVEVSESAPVAPGLLVLWRWARARPSSLTARTRVRPVAQRTAGPCTGSRWHRPLDSDLEAGAHLGTGTCDAAKADEGTPDPPPQDDRRGKRLGAYHRL